MADHPATVDPMVGVGPTCRSLPTGLLLGVVATATAASRLPFLLAASGLGPDSDAHRLVLAGRAIAQTGQYHLSRAPTYPVVELAAAVLAGAPDRVLVALTAVCGAIAVAAFADLLRTLAVGAWIPLTVAYAVTPVVLRSDLEFMDYSWASAPAMVGLALLARGRVVAAGVAGGLAVACRPSVAVLVLVGAVALALGTRRVRPVALHLGVAGVVASAFFLLPLTTYGLGFLTFSDQAPPWAVVAGRMSVDVWGAAGSVVLAVLAVAAVGRIRRGLPAATDRQRAWVLAAAVGIVATLAMYLRLPAEAGYLVPAVPLVMLVVAAAFPGPRAATALAAALLLGTLVTLGPRSFGTSAFEDLDERRGLESSVAQTVDAVSRLGPGTTVVLGRDLPRVVAEVPGWADGGAVPARTPDDPLIGETPPHRLLLPGGALVVSTLGPSDPPPTGPVFRGPRGSPADLPPVPSGD